MPRTAWLAGEDLLKRVARMSVESMRTIEAMEATKVHRDRIN